MAVTAEKLNTQQITKPKLPPGSQFQPVMQTPKPGEMMQGQNVDPTALNQTAQQAQTPQKTQANTYDPTTVGSQTPQTDAAQGELSDQAQVTAAQGGASDEFNQAVDDVANAVDDVDMDPRATVQHQFTELMDFEAGETPAWAKGALTTARQRLAAQGISASSMAGGTEVLAMLQAAMPIAQQDAQFFQTVHLKKMDQKAQAAIMRAGHLANLDLTNLNNRQQAAVVNAQNFLQMDLANLSNRQQANIVNTQARLQTLLSDQAAENAAKQFNAQSQNDIDKFFANLSAQIDTFNTAQQNDMSQFNATMSDAREKFNVKNALLVEQANTEYLRRINEANTSMLNQANLVNSQNLLNISNTAMANAITLLRDREAMIFEAGENAKQRALYRALEQLKSDHNMDMLDRKESQAWAQTLGSFAGNILTNWLTD